MPRCSCDQNYSRSHSDEWMDGPVKKKNFFFLILESMSRKTAMDEEYDWEKLIPYWSFAYREAP